jgi:hypothetical protein
MATGGNRILPPLVKILSGGEGGEGAGGKTVKGCIDGFNLMAEQVMVSPPIQGSL